MQPAPRRVGDRVDHGVRGIGRPGRGAEVDRLDAGEALRPALGGLLLELVAHLTGGERVVLLVVAEHQWPGMAIEPRPPMKTSQNVNAAPPMIAVVPKTLPMTPSRWS